MGIDPNEHMISVNSLDNFKVEKIEEPEPRDSIGIATADLGDPTKYEEI